MSTLKYWLWMAGLEQIGPLRTIRLLDEFGTPEAVYFADSEEYRRLDVLDKKACAALEDKRMDGAQRIMEDCDRLDCRIVTIGDAAYPDRLRQIANPPAVLFVRGRLPVLDETVAIGMVGARAATPYGIRTAERFSYELARQGALIVSGIAQGVDSACLRGALKAGGTPVAVLGNGVDVVYPRRSAELYDDVAAVGALVSEYPPGTGPLGEHFPVRNRIISGMTLGTVVVEAARQSGAVITAHLALDQGRDVFAVPGGVDAPMSEGTNRMIQMGEAKLVCRSWDILEEYADRWPGRVEQDRGLDEETARARLDTVPGRDAPPQTAPPACGPEAPDAQPTHGRETPAETREEWRAAAEFTDDEQMLLRALADGARTPDELVELTGLPARRVLSALTLLQVRGLAQEEPGKRFTTHIRLRAD